MLLFENQTVDGDSNIVKHKGGPLQIQVDGTFDGGTINIQVRQDNLSFVNLTNGAFTFNDVKIINIEDGSDYKATLSSAGASTNLTVSVI